MAAEEKPPRGTIATVVATAAVTLALGMTAAALGGYLVPREVTEKLKADVTEPALAEARPSAAQPSAPNVVLVPVAPDSPGPAPITAPAQPAAGVLLAAREPSHDRDDGEHHRGRKHREREHEDDEDDHDED